jgi:hypothetical protein
MATVSLSVKALKKGLKKAVRTNDWDDLVTVLNALVTIVTELKADHATFKTAADNVETLIEELHDDHATNKTAMDNFVTTLANYKTIYDAHTHTADGNASRTSLPDTGSPTGSPSAASAFTNTVGTPAATLTASKPASAPATLSAATPDTLALVN